MSKIDSRQMDKRIRVQIYSASRSTYRQLELSWRRLILYAILFGFGLALLMTGGYLLFNSVYADLGEKSFAQQSEALHSKIEEMESRYHSISAKMQALESNNRDLAVMANLPESEMPAPAKPLIDPDEDVYLAYSGEISLYDSLRIDAMIENLEQRIDATQKLQETLKDEFVEVEEKLEHLPSIRPLMRGRISDLFGNRKDPFIQRTRHHNGIDISAPRGTDIYAPAAGVVEFVKTRYRLNKGYGRVVILNHGDGLKTLYGHMSKVLVKRGQKVNRWDVLGQVGDTGRATGPHLHYEVWQNGKAIDPMEFILN